MNRRIIIGLALVSMLLGPSVLRADDLKNNFQNNLNQQAIDALTQDLGAMVSGGSFHTGKALGFPIGIDVGVHANMVGVQDENAILRDDGSSWGAAFVQGEVGLPFRFNVIGRAGSLGEDTVYGGGLRYGILDPSVPGLPSLSITALYNTMDTDYFSFSNTSFNAALSFDIPIIRPYIGVGYDLNSLDVESAAYVGAPGSATPNLESSESGYRAEAGLNLSIIPFTYITLGAGLANGEEMYHAGLGVTF